MTIIKKLRGMYENIRELPMLLKMPVIAGLALGVSYGATVSIKHLEDVVFSSNPPTPEVSQRIYDLEVALNETLERVETCGSNDDPNKRRSARITKNEGYVVGECLDSNGSARVWVGDERVSFSCYGKGCPEALEVTFHEYVPRFGTPPKVTRAFHRVDFALTEYKFPDALTGGVFELYAPHPRLHGKMAVYGAMAKTPEMQAAIQRARAKLSSL